MEESLGVYIPCSLMQCGLAPPRMDVFCQLTVLGKMLTVDNLRRRGERLDSISDLCSLCGKKESIDHLFVHGKHSYFNWHKILSRRGVLWCFLKSLVDLIEGWSFLPF